MKPKPCGTPAGYQRHYKAGEPICDACRTSYNSYQNEARERRRRANGVPPRTYRVLVTPTPSDYCGTQYGYNRHYRHGEMPCDQCRKANQASMRKWRG